MTQIVASPETTGLLAEIVALSGICNGVIPEDHDSLWKELSIWRGLSPSGAPATDARGVLESFGEAWDEDFLEETGIPSISALEAIHHLVTKASSIDKATGSVDLSEDEDDDDELDAVERDISAETSLWNIMTMVGLIKEGRLNLNPDWQRSFVWKPRKQRALIESLLLGLPIPSFLIYKDRETGHMSVIDGRQRLETISRFTAEKEAKGAPRMRFRTFGPTQEGWKPNQYLNPAASKFYSELPNKFRTQFDTRNLQVAVLDVPLDHLYQIFKRYNTGSVALNAAEIRNAVFQTSALHTMMFRLGGEHRDLSKYKDTEEADIGEDLRDVMRNKQSRYGAYDFIGRVLAFRYESKGSVAKAIFSFMAREHRAPVPVVERYRRDFIDSFLATTRWYEFPLIEPRTGGAFHAFLATIQMVSSSHLVERINAAQLTEEVAAATIKANWLAFASKVLQEKQNSTNFWKFQREWLELVNGSLPR